MKRYPVSWFLTIVVGLFVSGNVSLAAESTHWCTEAVIKQACSGKTGDDYKKCAKETCEPASDDSTTCKAAYAGMTKARSAMTAACASAGVSRDCEAEMLRCTNGCDGWGNGSDDLPEFLRAKCDLVANSSRLSSIGFSESQLGQFSSSSSSSEALRERFEKCSPEVGAMYKDYKDEYQETRDRIEAGEDKVQAITEKIQEIQQEIANKQIEYEEKRKELKRAFEDKLAELKAEFEKVNAELADMVTKLSQVIFDAQEQLRKLASDEAVIRQEEQDRILSLKQSCLASALEALKLRREQRSKDIAEGKYSAGSVGNLYKAVGTAQKTKDGYFVDKLAAECEAGTAFKRNVTAIKQMAALRIRKEITDVKPRVQKAIDDAKAQIQKVQTDDTKRALEKHKEALELLNSRTNEEFQSLAKIEATEMMALNSKLQNAQMELMRAQTRMAEDRSDYNEARDAMNIAKRASSGLSNDSSKYHEAVGKYTDWLDSVTAVNLLCDCEESDISEENRRNCRNAKIEYGIRSGGAAGTAQ